MWAGTFISGNPSSVYEEGKVKAESQRHLGSSHSISLLSWTHDRGEYIYTAGSVFYLNISIFWNFMLLSLHFRSFC